MPKSDSEKLKAALKEIEVLHEVLGRQERCIVALLDQRHNRRPPKKLPKVLYV
jgi:hypothetical protein